MDLRQFIAEIERMGELEVIQDADPHLEMGAITELSAEEQGKALLFDRIKGFPEGYRIITNFISTAHRLGVAMGFPADIRNVELIRSLKDAFRDLKPIDPVYVSDGPVTENVYRDGEVDLLKFPAPRWHEYDGGRYFGTGDMVVQKHPEEGWVNVGTYRTQLHDKETVALNIAPGNHGAVIRQAYWAKGKACPVAVVLGCHPRVWIPSLLGFPWGVEEYSLAGGLLGKPLELVRGEYTGLPVPADAEMVIEGDCPPPEVDARDEGPFGEWPGYYGRGVHKEAVIKVKRIMHRNNPIILGAPPLKPPLGVSGAMRAAHVWMELEKLGIPGIKGMWNMRSGGSKLLHVIAIEQKYAGHAMQVAMAAMSGTEGARHGKFTVIVDDDIDPSDDAEVLWAIATRCDPATSIQVIRDCWSSPLEPTLTREKKASGDITNSRAIILACRPYYWKKDFPRVNRASDELRRATFNKWRRLFSRASI